MKNFVNTITSILSTGVNLLLIGYPQRTSLGALFGVFMKILVKIFYPIFSKIPNINLVNLSDWEIVVLGIVIFHIPTFFSQILGKNRFNENEEKAFEIIRQAKNSGISPWEIQNMYLKLAEKILDNIELKQSTKEEIQKMMEQ